MQESFERLPVYSRREEIIAALQKNQVLIIAGETGSGKSTLLPFFCREAGLSGAGKIAITEPRRIAAIALATYAARLNNSSLGTVVGYMVRYRRKMRADAEIIYMTDGILVASLVNDPQLSRYSVIIIDEAHERSLNIDFLLGYLRILLRKRSGLRLVIMSATIDTGLFSRAFFHAPVIVVEGRRANIDIQYKPVVLLWKGVGIDSFIEGVCAAVQEICRSGERGDILVFLPTVDDVSETVNRLPYRIKEPEAVVLPLHGRLTFNQQREVFRRFRGRKIVVATNIAETSLTVPGIRFVIDSGLVRMLRYEPAASITRMPIEKISRASADQRAGRCGRVQDGICIRLYSEADFAARPAFTLPEVKRANCAGLILRMHLQKGIAPDAFPFLQRPSSAALHEGYRHLRELGALDNKNRLTGRGQAMARLPLDPPVACMLLAAREFGTVREVMIIAAALSATDPLAVHRHAGILPISRFRHPDSDFLTFVNIWDYLHGETDQKGALPNPRLRSLAERYGLHPLRLREWIDAYDHLERICGTSHRCTGNDRHHPVPYEAVHKCLLAGLIGGIAVRKAPGSYEGVSVRDIHVASVSVNAGKNKPWLLFHELVETDRIHGTRTAAIDPKWVEELFGEACVYHHENPWYDTDTGLVYINEIVSYRSLVLIEHRRRECHTVDRTTAADVFIREALVGEKIGDRYRFCRYNKDVKQTVLAAERKLRKKIYAGDEVFEAFYEEGIHGIATRSELDAFLKTAGNEKTLFVSREILLAEPLPPDIDAYHDTITVASYRLPVEWRHDPGGDTDGATVVIPEKLADMLPLYYWEWQLPVLCRKRVELLVARITGLLLKRDIDPADAVERILTEEILPTGPWIETVLDHVERLFAITVDRALFQPETFPLYLWLAIVVVSAQGMRIDTWRPPLTSRRINRKRSFILTDEFSEAPVLGGAIPETAERADSGWQHKGALLQALPVASNGQEVPCAVWMALYKHEGNIFYRRFSSEEAALGSHAEALQHILEERFAEQLAWESESVALPESLVERATAAGINIDVSMVTGLMVRRILALPETLPMTYDQFSNLMEDVARRIPGSATATVQLVAGAITAFEQAMRQCTKRKGRYALIGCAWLGEAFAAEIEYYRNAFVNSTVSAGYIEKLPQYLATLAGMMERASDDPAGYRRVQGTVTDSRGVIAMVASVEMSSGYRLWCIRERLRNAVELYRAEQLSTITKKRGTGVDDIVLEALRQSVIRYYRDAERR